MLAEAVMTMITVWVERLSYAYRYYIHVLDKFKENYHFKIYITLKLTQSTILLIRLISADFVL